jgi:lipopolysaccharide biosynthesis regulator YciM
MGQGKYDDAVSLLQRAYQAKANAVQSMNSLTSAYLKANRKNEALVFLKSIVAKSPENANALVQLGSIQLSEGETDKAVGSFSAAVKAQPRIPLVIKHWLIFTSVRRNTTMPSGSFARDLWNCPIQWLCR